LKKEHKYELKYEGPRNELTGKMLEKQPYFLEQNKKGTKIQSHNQELN
jgi:hypothetical protein